MLQTVIAQTNIQHDNFEIISGPMLDYISRYLLEEDIDENNCGYQEEADLREMERSFYDVLGERYPHSPKNQLLLSQSKEDPKPTICLSEDQSTTMISAQNLMVDNNILASEFQRGMEEGNKFVPTIHKLTVDLQLNTLSSDSERRDDRRMIEVRSEEEENFRILNRSRGNKKSSNVEFELWEGGNRKKPMIHYEETIRDEMYDKVLLNQGEKYEKEEVSGLREIMQQKASSYVSKKIQDHIDINTLLTHCSEAVSVNNYRLAEGLLMQIRQQASRTGDGAQRLACILADGLEARLAGSGSELYRQLVAKRINSADILQSYHLCIRADPFHRVSYCFANNNILKVIKNAPKVHIIDLGICFGFQWPTLIQSLATRQGGPPKLRITGVDFPQRGFRPAKQLEEVGKRLEEYARSFNVSFEYQGIASEWELICIEDLNIKEDEVCIVNSTNKFSQVQDEACNLNSPRNQVLNLIRRIKPQLYIQGIYNARFSSYFTVRFRQVLLQYSMEFDMRDSLIPRDNKHRQLTEKQVIAPIIINLIACEGSDWLERPETYKNWQLRNVRAGFEQLPLDLDIVNECKTKLRNGYDKRFFIEEDGKWMLQGWKGKIRHAFSTWKPKSEIGNGCAAHKNC